MASLDITTTGNEQDPPAIVREATAPPRPRREGAAEEEEEENDAQGDFDTDPQNTTTSTTYDPHEYQPPHPDADTDKDTTDKEKKKAIAVKFWCGNPNCEKELDPKKLKSCSRCKVIKYCCRDCQTVSSGCGWDGLHWVTASRSAGQ